MNIIQTLFMEESKNVFRDSFGWAAAEYHLMSWTLSCLQLKKYHKNVYLYANSKAARILIDILELPYDKVFITHDNLKLNNPSLWALPKIHTYSMQESPFLHVDGDVFIFAPFEDKLLNGELIVQNIENVVDRSFGMHEKILNNLEYVPECVKDQLCSGNAIYSINAGILGGNNIDFIREYAKLSFAYVERNISSLDMLNTNRFNTYFEQHLFYSFAKEFKLPISVLFSEIVNDNEYTNLADFHKLFNNKNYLHFLGHFKQYKQKCIKMAEVLRSEYPEYYYKIIMLFKANNEKTYIKYPSDKTLDSIEDYLVLSSDSVFYYINCMNKNKYLVHNYSIRSITPSEISLILKKLQNLAELEILNSNFYFKNKLAIEYQIVSKQLNDFLTGISKKDFRYFYGRNFKAVNWFNVIFKNGNIQSDVEIVICSEFIIIESEFDWSKHINSCNEVDVKPSNKIEFSIDKFFNLVVYEINDNVKCICIDEIDKLIIDTLQKSMKISELFEHMIEYAEQDIIDNHLSLYRDLISSSITQLVLLKIIRPVYQ